MQKPASEIAIPDALLDIGVGRQRPHHSRSNERENPEEHEGWRKGVAVDHPAGDDAEDHSSKP